MNSSQLMQYLKRYRVLIIVVLLVLVSLFILSRIGFVKIEVENAGDGEISYQILDNKGRTEAEIKTSSKTIKKRLKRGGHSILVKQGSVGAYAFTKSGGFFSSKSVKASLSPEKYREFVGNNPSPCMYYPGDILYSYECSGDFNEINIHEPATGSQPTYVLQNKGGQDGEIESIIGTKSGAVALLTTADIASEDTGGHILYRLNSGINAVEPIVLRDLDSDTQYKLTPYKDGFIAYSPDFSKMLYYSPPYDYPKALDISAPKDKKLKAVALGAKDDQVVVVYSSQPEPDDQEEDSKISSSVEIKVLNGTGEQKTIKLKDLSVQSANLCGTNKLCILSEGNVLVYDIRSKTPALLFTVPNALGMESFGSGVLVFQMNAVLNINVDSQKGSIDYSDNNYSFCGYYVYEKGYVLCLIDSQNNKVALDVQPARSVEQKIDEQVANLLNSDADISISVYRNNVFIAPNYGALVYVPTEQTYDYDPAYKQKVIERVREEVQKSGINTSVYNVVINGS